MIPQIHQVLDLAALPIAYRAITASPRGLEPLISTVTGWRALQLLREDELSSSSGGTRTHSIPGSKPRWSADCLPSHVLLRCPRRDSNPQALGFKPSRSAVGVLGRYQMIPDGLEPSLSGCRPEVVAAGPRDRMQWTHRESHPNLRFAGPMSSCWTMSPCSPSPSGSRGTRTHKRDSPPPVFKTGSSSGRMTSVAAAATGIEPVSRRLIPARRDPYQHGHHRNVSQRGRI